MIRQLNSIRMNKSVSSLTCALCLLILNACQATNPTRARVAAQPEIPVVKNITGFTNSLRCMDELFLQYGKSGIVITSDGLPDHTGEVSAGTKDMMITSLSKMSEKSNAFRFVDIEQTGAVSFIQNDYLGQGFDIPGFYIRGAITQIDRNVIAEDSHVGGALPWLSLAYSKDQLLSLMTVDMNIGETLTRQIVPGLHTTNTITLVRSSNGFDTEGIIEKASLFFEVAQERASGTHQSLRTLIELSLIEVLGKLTKVPYWRCLGLESTNPTLIAQAQDWYDGLARQEQIRVIQSALNSVGIYQGPADGMEQADFTRAVQHYQAQNDLVADGRVNFDLYYRLLVDNRAVVPHVTKQGAKGQPAQTEYKALTGARQPEQRGSGEDPVGLKLEPLQGLHHQYQVGEELTFKISVQQPAVVHCYYEYAENGQYHTARVFPNRWQSDARVSPQRPLILPDNKVFKLYVNQAGANEKLICIGRPIDATNQQVPLVFNETDLEPLTSVRRIYQVVDAYQQIDRYESSIQTLAWKVF